MGTEELERAAQRRRDRDARDAAAGDAATKKRAIDRVAGARRMKRVRVAEALAEAGWRGKLFTGAALMIGMFGPMAIGIVWFDEDSLITLGLTSLACMAGAFAAAFGAEQLLAGIRRQRLYRIGRGFDPKSYLDALGENRRHAIVIVRARFTRAWPDDARNSARDAVREWMPSLASVTWDDDTLVLRSGSLDGTEWLSGGQHSSGGRFFNNRTVHGCFMQVLDDVVPHLEEVAPIDRLSVELEGSIEAWDADA